MVVPPYTALLPFFLPSKKPDYRFKRQSGYLFRPATFRPCFATGLALSRFGQNVMILQFYVIIEEAVNGTRWHLCSK